MAFIWGDGGAQLTPEAIAAQRKVAQAMMEKGSDYSPVQSWAQGAARVAQGVMGGLDARQANEAERQNATAEKELLASLITGGGVAPAAASVPPSAAAPVAAPAAAPANKEQFLSTVTPIAAAASEKTGIDPRIIVAQAALETGWGKSAPGNNYFGIKSHGQPGGNTLPTTEVVNGQPVRTADSFRAYASPQDSGSGYADFINANPRYAGLKGAQGFDAQVAALGKSGYATDPAYADKVRSIALSLPPTAAPAPVSAPAASVDPAALPPNAQSAAGYAIPGQPAASPSVNPKLLTAMASPYVSDGTKKVLGIMLQSQLSSEGVTPIDAGNKIILTDKRGNVVRELPKGEPNKGPEYGVIGKDQFGNEQYGWRDPRTQSVTPGPQGTAQPATVTGPDGQPMAIPAGQDPKVYREAASKSGAANALPANFDDTSKLRTEISQLPSYKNISQAAPIYRSMADAAGRNTKAADLNMVYGLGKIMDPGSVVREGEIQMANNAQGWQEKLNGVIAQINGQGGLTPEGRQALMAEAHSRMQSYKMMYDQDAQRYRGIAQRNRANPDDVVADFGTFDPWTVPKGAAPPASSPARTPAPPEPGAVKDGYRFKGGNPADPKNWEQFS